jgi:hypothetical protein
MFFLNCQSKFVRSTWAIGRCPGFSQARAERMSSDMRLTPGGRSCLFQKIYSLVSAKFSLSHAAISAPQLLDCEALLASL